MISRSARRRQWRDISNHMGGFRMLASGQPVRAAAKLFAENHPHFTIFRVKASK